MKSSWEELNNMMSQSRELSESEAGANTDVKIGEEKVFKETESSSQTIAENVQMLSNSNIPIGFVQCKRVLSEGKNVLVQEKVDYNHKEAMNEDIDSFLDSIRDTIVRASTYDVVLDSKIENFGLYEFDKPAAYLDIQEDYSVMNEYADNPFNFMKNRLAASLREEGYENRAEEVKTW